MVAFTKGDPETVHHLPRDEELLIELPERIQIHRILVDHQNLPRLPMALRRPLQERLAPLV